MKTNYYSPDLKALTSKAVKRLEEISLERITELDNSVTEINCMRDYLLANEPAVKKYVDKGSRVFKERALGGGLAVASIFALGFLGFLFEKKKDFYSRQEAEKEFEFRCLRKHLKQESKPQAIH